MTEFDKLKDIATADPVCGKVLNPDEVRAQELYAGWAYFFCSEQCRDAFVNNPNTYIDRRTLAPDHRE